MGESAFFFLFFIPPKTYNRTMDPSLGAQVEHQPTDAVSQVPELTASGKPKKRFVGKARRQQQQEGANLDPSSIEESAVAIRDGKTSANMFMAIVKTYTHLKPSCCSIGL
jgi:hypothetical protein